MAEETQAPRVNPGKIALAVAALITLATAILYLAHTHHHSGSWLSAPLDDTFIHFQYARQLARGRLLQFNDGDTATTGATSLLYLFLLAPGWLVGFKGLHLLIWAWIVNAGLHVAGGVTVFAIVARLTGRRLLAYTAMIALLLHGPLLWGVFSNMEIALFSTLILLTLLEAIRLDEAAGAAPPPRRLLVWGCLLALVRPEGALLAGGLSLWLLARHVSAGGAWRDRLRGAWRPLLPLMAGVALILLFLALTGRIATNAATKSHLPHLAHMRDLYVEMSTRWLTMTLQILIDMWPRIIQPLSAAMVLGGLGFWAAAGRWRRPGPGKLVLLWMVQLSLFYALFMARRDHFDRYYLPYFGLSLVVFWWALGKLAARGGKLAAGPGIIGVIIIFLGLPQTFFWANRFGLNCRDFVNQHIKAAAWLKKHTPPGARIAVNDAGIIPYLSERYTYDIVGLAHNAFYKRKSHMKGKNVPVWEALEALEKKPQYMAAYPEWIPDLHRLPVFFRKTAFRLQDKTIAANMTKVIWELRWDVLHDPNAAPAPFAARRLIDRLDVGDLANEERHGYGWRYPGWPSGMVGRQRIGDRWLIDGGRTIKEGERFTLGARPGEPATLVLRTHGPGPLDLEVRINDRSAGRWKATRPPGHAILSFDLPAKLVSADRLLVELSTKSPYTSFHYWLVQ